MPPNSVQKIVNDCNYRTIHFPIDHKNRNFHIVFLLSFAESFADIRIKLVLIYAQILTLPYTNILTLNADIYSFYLFHFQFEVVKSKKGWNNGNKSYCYGSVSYHKHESSPIKCYISRRQWKCIMYLSKLATHISKWWNVGSKNSYCPMIKNFGVIRLTKF